MRPACDTLRYEGHLNIIGNPLHKQLCRHSVPFCFNKIKLLGACNVHRIEFVHFCIKNGLQKRRQN